MARNPHATRGYASAIAVGGLVVLMVQEVPNWNATLIGLLSLIAFAVLWILAGREVIEEGARAPVRVAVTVHDIEADDAAMSEHRLLLGPPGHLELLEPRRSPTILSLRRLPKLRWK
ncbi:hypothetical protein [Methylobacterium sp. WCS2018Hpa-22]|uniref:hypothetical protein n=1 Tax=Methylobacterium sp. WCS2018Hpa-22 TaxID=3073633 RepID=UPI00288A7D4E|nr:hypothetical protein [Methylobacterium sp. WCS2018Hpa-22]